MKQIVKLVHLKKSVGMKNTTNVFPILNLDKLSCKYRLFKIKGLLEESTDYEKNKNIIIKKLSSKLSHPVTVIEKEHIPYLVIRDEADVIAKLPKELPLVANPAAIFEHSEEVMFLDFNSKDSASKEICLRFLNFDLNAEISKKPSLWRPAAGKAFFKKIPKIDGNVSVYNGFNARVISLPKGFGVAIDVTKKFISSKPLPTEISREYFNNQVKGKTFLYKYEGYGYSWYEVRIDKLSDLTVSTHKYKSENQVLVSLIEDLRGKFKRPHTKELADLSDNGSVLFYSTNDNQERGVPSALCYEVYDSENNFKLHSQSLVNANERFAEIKEIKKSYFENLYFGGVKLSVSEMPFTAEVKSFLPPDLEFGQGKILSARRTANAVHCSVADFGKFRKKLLLSSEAGYYSCDEELQRQFFVLPKSIEDSMGGEFLRMLVNEVNSLYKNEKGYNPEILSYEDRNDKIDLGVSIIRLIKNQIGSDAFGVIMIPNIGRSKRSHDDLEAMLIRELKKDSCHVSIIHTSTVKKAFRYERDGNGNGRYVVQRDPYDRRNDWESKLKGYVHQVAINKVLLTNEKFPFVLSTPLNADLTIGIDVKNHIAGISLVNKYGNTRLVHHPSSGEKERLSAKRMRMIIKKQVSAELNFLKYPIQSIVIHRDGRIFNTEMQGINQAIEELVQEGRISPNICVNIVEISKSAINSVRLFEQNYNFVGNPAIGSYQILGNVGVLCNTGKEYIKNGTVNPLIINYIKGNLEFEEVLEDIYSLSNLTYSKIDFCSRFPLTTKITDRFLSEIASEYDEENLQYHLEELEQSNY